MKNILLLDTSIATNNIGDEIIMECVRDELTPILKNNFIRTLPTHVSPFHWYQVWKNSLAIRSFTNCDLKFVGGSNILIPNLLTHYPQWNINLFNYKPLKGCILVGVGAGAGAENGSNFYTRYIYQHLLNKQYYHSVRDERSKQYMDYLGIKSINTGCITMWLLSPEFCSKIPTNKSDKVVFTLTAQKIKDEQDQWIIDILVKNYKKVYFWPQGLGDYEYFHQFSNIDNINVLEASKKAYDTFLNNNDTDYIGTRLHGGIYAIRHKKRTLIIAIDERTIAINKNNNLNCILKSKVKENLEGMIQSKIVTNIIMQYDNIEKWKRQFY